jgi:hypothetical protein
MVLSAQLTPQQLRRRPKVVNPTSLFATTFSGHDGNFEPTVERKCPSSTPHK